VVLLLVINFQVPKHLLLTIGQEGGVLDLFYDNNLPLFNVNMEIKIDKKGNFTGVKEGDKTYSVEAWNAKIENDFNK